MDLEAKTILHHNLNHQNTKEKKIPHQEEILKVLQDKEAGAPGGPEGWEGWCWFPTNVVPSLKIIFSKSTRNTQIASPVAPSLCLFYQ